MSAYVAYADQNWGLCLLAVQQLATEDTRYQERIHGKNPSRHRFGDGKVFAIEDDVVLEDSHQHDNRSEHPEEHFQRFDKPWTARRHAILLHAIDDETDADEEGSEEEGFVRVMEAQIDGSRIRRKAICNAGAKNKEQHYVKDEEDLSDGFEAGEVEWLLAEERRQTAC
jgi:hypothetical protein